MIRKRDIAMYAVALVLAFVVGTLVGRDCASVAEVPEPTPNNTVECDPIKEIVYECPPDAGQTEPQTNGDGAPQPAKAKKRALPKTDPPITPKQRKRLLAWVRDQSVDLEGCRSAAKQTYRLSVTLELDEGKVRKVKLNAPASELPSNVAGCLRQRMRGWRPPDELIEGRRELVFGLTL